MVPSLLRAILLLVSWHTVLILSRYRIKTPSPPSMLPLIGNGMHTQAPTQVQSAWLDNETQRWCVHVCVVATTLMQQTAPDAAAAVGGHLLG
jgi:hypothetical protein